MLWKSMKHSDLTYARGRNNWQSLFGSSVVCVIIVKDAMTPLLIPKLRVSILSSRTSTPSWPSPLGLSRPSQNMQNPLKPYT
jgi:hypothetical protein